MGGFYRVPAVMAWLILVLADRRPQPESAIRRWVDVYPGPVASGDIRARYASDLCSIVRYVGHMRRFGSLITVLVTIVVLVAACSLPQSPTISVQSGLSPRMKQEQLVTAGLDRIHQMEQAAGRVAATARIVSLTATTPAGVAGLEPNAGSPGQPGAAAVVWVVRAEGTFFNERVPPGAEPIVGTSGFFVIADADGSVIGFGMP